MEAKFEKFISAAESVCFSGSFNDICVSSHISPDDMSIYIENSFGVSPDRLLFMFRNHLPLSLCPEMSLKNHLSEGF